jgi:hypothetical protein
MKFPNLRSLIALSDGAAFWICRAVNVITPHRDVMRMRHVAPKPGAPHRDFVTQTNATACAQYPVAS